MKSDVSEKQPHGGQKKQQMIDICTIECERVGISNNAIRDSQIYRDGFDLVGHNRYGVECVVAPPHPHDSVLNQMRCPIRIPEENNVLKTQSHSFYELYNQNKNRFTS